MANILNQQAVSGLVNRSLPNGGSQNPTPGGPSSREITKNQVNARKTSADSFDETVTLEEQAAYNQVIRAAMTILRDTETSKNIAAMLKKGKDNPPETIATLSALLIEKLDEQSGGKIPETVVIPASIEIMELVAALGEKDGYFVVDDNVYGKSIQLLLMKLADQYDVDMDDLQVLMNSVDKDQLQAIIKEQGGYASSFPGAQGLAKSVPGEQAVPDLQAGGQVNAATV